MFFQRTGKLRREFDEKLLLQFSHLKKDWLDDKSLLDRSFDPSEEVICAAKLSEAKYFFLFKEAKQRKIKILK
ncbi:YaaL family protein [Bacillus sp. B1-b2]|uniref:YaaL family protein n=1 Tax=Bacillus sp. B1-b2 TaxID=2653201 RepID=UPI001262599A|nr:YaaL family protein [Bacillus sp. B1-b2]KAB7663451.1 DUF2508 family protein [Bacillus sp. B1-b2]